MAPEDIAKGIEEIDAERFSVEQLNRLLEMVPTDAEIRSVVNFKGDCELGPPELFCQAFDGVLRPRVKVNCMCLMKNFDDHANDISGKLQTALRACAQVSHHAEVNI